MLYNQRTYNKYFKILPIEKNKIRWTDTPGSAILKSADLFIILKCFDHETGELYFHFDYFCK
jgi:hypothetical protein